MKLVSKEYRTVSQIRGPLIFVERIADVAFNEIVRITGPDGSIRYGRVLEVDKNRALVQVFVSTAGLDLEHTSIHFTEDVARIDVSPELLGRVLNGMGQIIDGGTPIIPEVSPDINGLPINPVSRAFPREFIQTGISAIDGMNTLVRGQKLPIFSCAGLPANQLAAHLATQAHVLNEGNEGFAIVFAAIGITHRETTYFREQFEKSGALQHIVMVLNKADDPTIERLLTPRVALTIAEYLAFELDKHVLVVLTDITNYCEALREISAAREEIPGRRGYPGYLYSDLASIYERAGRLHNRSGSVTQLIILTMPNDDITHPIPDLSGYITEGQIVLNRELHRKGIYPPIDVLTSLSRLMKAGIGEGYTRADHRAVAEQLYALYAEGGDLRRLSSIIGESALTLEDRRVLDFTEAFETNFVGQGITDRSIDETLNLAWKLFRHIPANKLKRIPQKFLDQYHHPEQAT